MDTPTPFQVESAVVRMPKRSRMRGYGFLVRLLILVAALAFVLWRVALANENEATLEQWQGGVEQIVRAHCVALGGELSYTVNYQLGMVFWFCELPMPNTPKREL